MSPTNREAPGVGAAPDVRPAQAQSPAWSSGDQTALLGAVLAAALAVFVVPGTWDWVNTALGVTLLLVIHAYDRDPENSWPHLLAFGAVWGMCCEVATGVFFELELEARGRPLPEPDYSWVVIDGQKHYGVSTENASRLKDYEVALIWMLFGAIGVRLAGVKRGRWQFNIFRRRPIKAAEDA